MEKSFNISTHIYSIEAIQASIQAFIEIWNINYTDWNVSISAENTQEIDNIFLEFMNYVVFISNES